MNVKLLLFTTFLFCLSFICYSQPPVPPGSGCLMPDNTFLTSYNMTTTSGTNYRYSFFASPSYNRFCSSSAAQYIRLGSAVNAPNFNINCGTTTTYAGNNVGVMYYYTLLQCPLDEKAWCLLFPIAYFALRSFTRNEN